MHGQQFRSFCTYCDAMSDFTEGWGRTHVINTGLAYQTQRLGIIHEARQVRAQCNHCDRPKQVVRASYRPPKHAESLYEANLPTGRGMEVSGG